MHVADHPSSERPLELELPAEPRAVTAARHAAGDYAGHAGADREAVELAVAEAVSNAVIHGFRDRPRGTIHVRAAVERDHLIVSVTDDGIGMMPNPESPGLGLGLPLIGRLTSEVRLGEGPRGGVAISMVFPREASA